MGNITLLTDKKQDQDLDALLKATREKTKSKAILRAIDYYLNARPADQLRIEELKKHLRETVEKLCKAKMFFELQKEVDLLFNPPVEESKPAKGKKESTIRCPNCYTTSKISELAADHSGSKTACPDCFKIILCKYCRKPLVESEDETLHCPSCHI